MHPEVADRLEAELRLLDISVSRDESELGGDALETWPQAHEGAEALVVLIEEPLRIVLWTRETNLTLKSPAVISDSDLLALQAVELLRGLLSSRPGASPTRSSPGPALRARLGAKKVRAARQEEVSVETSQAAPKESSGTERARPWGFFVGPQIAWGPGGVNALPGFRGTFSRRLLPSWGLEIDGFSSAGAASARAPGGDLSVRAYSLGARTSIHHRFHPRVESSLMLGGGAWGVSWRRSSEIPSLDVRESRAVARAGAEVGSTFWVSSSAGIRVDGGLTYLFRRIELEAPHPSEVIANQSGQAEEPSIGRLLWVGTAGFELRF